MNQKAPEKAEAYDKAIRKLTLVTATWKVYSVISEGVLFEYDADIDIGESGLSERVALKTIVTAVFDTIISFEAGKEELSTGSADAKFQSSSAPTKAPLLC